jgi:uncharacterized protein (UPF0261 family)
VTPVSRRSDPDFVRVLERHDPLGPAILVIGTVDTKHEEITFLADAIVEAGGSPVLLDSSVSDGRARSRYPLIAREQVAAAAKSAIEEIAALPRGEAVERMQGGVREVVHAVVARGLVDGAICIGGAGAHLAGPAFQSLPIGFPKLIVSPLASGRRQFEPYVGLRDVAVMHSVADIAGINDITAEVFSSAAGYIVGAARFRASRRAATAQGATAKPTIAISMNGNTTRAMDRGRARLQAAGYAAVTFHANGVGGRALEDFATTGKVAGVLDYTTTELGAQVLGGLMDAGPTRMETAGRLGIPQVLVPGCCDFITTGTWTQAEAEFPGRLLFRHNPELTLVRLSAQEMASLGALFARKANLATGSTAVLFPQRGLSVNDADGGLFWDPVADRSFLDELRSNLRPDIPLEVIDAHVNDARFADAAVEVLLGLLAERRDDDDAFVATAAAGGQADRHDRAQA